MSQTADGGDASYGRRCWLVGERTCPQIGAPAASGTVVAWYHDTMPKNFTVRLPDEEAADVEALARAEGVSLNETVRRALAEAVERRRGDPAFKERVRRIIKEDRELLERLAR